MFSSNKMKFITFMLLHINTIFIIYVAFRRSYKYTCLEILILWLPQIYKYANSTEQIYQ